MFAGVGASVSVGTHASGALLRGVALPREGTGYEVPGPWRARDRLYTTETVARWLTDAFAAVERELPGARALLGDLSARGGGRTPEHRSHGSGRDVDIFFYAVDWSGRPYHPRAAMLRFGPDGRAVAWSPPTGAPAPRDPLPLVRLDTRRTWALVRALVSDPRVQVQWIFIHRALASLLVGDALAAGEDPAVVARAAALFHQPTDALPHDDHMHVRVYCPTFERPFGCVDRGPVRWWKKRWKYMLPAPPPSPL